MTNTPTQLPSWTEAVRSHLAELTPQTARTCLHLEQVAATVATADAGLVEPASRTRDPFSWAAAATFECADAAACFEEIADWPIHRRPVSAACRLADAATDELLAGSRQLLTAAHSATLTLAAQQSQPGAAVLLTDAASDLIRPLLTTRP